MNEATKKAMIDMETDDMVYDVLDRVFEALNEKGYDAWKQITEYLFTEDPVYITSYNNARAMITLLDREDIMKALLQRYLAK